MSHPSEQLEMFPDALPGIVVRIYRAARCYYATGTHDVLTDEVLARYLEKDGKASSVRTIERARRKYRHLLPTPLTREMVNRPPWHDRPGLVAATTEWAGDALPPDPEQLFVLVDIEPPFVIREVNDAACRVSRYTRDELRGTPAGLLLRPDQPDSWPNPALATLKQWILEGKRSAIRWESHWEQKGTHARINLLVRQKRDTLVPGCWAMHSTVMPWFAEDGRIADDDPQVWEAYALHGLPKPTPKVLKPWEPGRMFGPGALSAAGLVVAVCADSQHPLHHALKLLLEGGRLLVPVGCWCQSADRQKLTGK